MSYEASDSGYNITGHFTRMEETRNAYNIWLETPKGRDNSGDLDIDVRIILQ
jgi:hypothetical protein